MTRLVFILLAALLFYLWWRSPRPRGAWRRSALSLAGAGLLALAYVGWPLDLLPDFTPVGFLDDLLVLVTTAVWIHHQWQQRPRPRPAGQAAPPPAADADEGWNPYRVLELRRDASREQIARAYREQMKRYHPDRVNGLGPELQELAHRKALDIQRAYQELTAQG